MESEKNIRGRRIIMLLCLLLTGYLICKWQRVFYQVATGDIYSDVPAHIKLALGGNDYGLASALIHLLYGSGNNSFAPAALSVCLTLSNVLTLFTLYLLIRELFPGINGWTVLLACDLALVCGPWIIPGYQEEIYLGALNGNQYHNMTVLFSRVFVPTSLLYFLRCWRERAGRIDFKNWLLLTVNMFLCTAFKPNFAFAFIPVLAVLLVYELICRRGKTFKNLVILGCSVLPAGITCIWQYLVLFDDNFAGTSSQMAVRTYSFAALVSLLVMLLRSLLLPVYTGVLQAPKEEKRKDISMISIIFAVSLLEYAFLTETGFRATDGNFEWGALAIYPVIFAVSIALLFRILGREHKGVVDWLLGLGGLGLLLGHVLTGAYFMYFFSSGGSYFI